MNNTIVKTEIQPYIFFYGKCEQALEFYKSVFGGSYEIMRVKDAPMEMPGDGNRVMHGSFSAGEINFLCSDGRETKDVDSDAGNVCIALATPDAATAERYFNALAQGGSVGHPFGDAFWGQKFGNLVDKFGTEWMITAPQ